MVTLFDDRHQIHVKQVGATRWYDAFMNLTACLSWCIYCNYDPPLFLFSNLFVKGVEFFSVQLCCNTKICIYFMIVMESNINGNQTSAEVNSWVTWTSRIFQLWWPSNRLQFHLEAKVWAKNALGTLEGFDKIVFFPVLPQKWRSPENVIWYGGCLWCCSSSFSDGYLLSLLSSRCQALFSVWEPSESSS